MLRQLATFVSSNARPRAPLLASRTLSAAPAPNDSVPTITFETDDGRKFAVLDSKKLPKLQPSIVKRRLNRCKTVVERERDIRTSPWRLNLICQMIAGMTVKDAFLQLKFCEKRFAPRVSKLLEKAVENAEVEHHLKPSQLEVAECFVTKGKPLKRIKIMGKGR